MINLILESISAAFLFAAFSFFYKNCMEEGGILFWWRKILELRIPNKFAMPLGLCPYCFNMQLSIWSCVVLVSCGYLNVFQAVGASLLSHIILKHLLINYD